MPQHTSTSPETSPEPQQERRDSGAWSSLFRSRFALWIYLAIILAAVVHLALRWGTADVPTVEYSTFLDHIDSGYIERVKIINGTQVRGTYTPEAIQSGQVPASPREGGSLLGFADGNAPRAFRTTKPDDHALTAFLRRYNKTAAESSAPTVTFTAVEDENWIGTLLLWGLPLGLIVGMGVLYVRRMRTESQAPEVGDSTATLLDGSDAGDLTFDDVAGLEEAKEEVAEVVEFLRRPGKFTRLGGTLPKGILLVGPPGTGKTLMAKAVAGEAGVPFFSISGTDFVEMFVGIGASRVRDLFESAKEKAPCIIFIDEMDAIGRTRGGGPGSGSDERENTLNQLLVEMDGFDSEEGVVIMAATNRPDVLDSALLRPGRFDRQIVIDKPDRIDREKIFRVHVRGLRLDDAVELERLARQTPGFAGAEIANVCNEAALLAARKDKEAVQTKDFEQAIDRVIAGLEKKNKLISPEERRVIAYHESGHAIVGWELERTDPIVKVSIVPRGLSALGYAQHLPEERDLYSEDALKDRMTAALGGRVAEKIALGRVTTGAQNDLERVTDMAYAMVVDYGMSDRVGPLSYNRSHRNEDTPLFDKPYSDAMAETIDEEVQGIVEAVQSRAADILREKRAQLDEMADALLEKETLGPEALRNILGERPGGESGSADVAVALDGRTNTPGGAKPPGKEDGSSSESGARNPSSETTGKPAP